jgi:hypothetical protein
MTKLWAVHVQGPDSIIAMPDLETAELRAKEWNAMFERLAADRGNNPFDPTVKAVVINWGRHAKSHARDLAEHGGNPKDLC